MFEPYSRRWGLIADGDPITTPTATLFPVLWRGRPAMLKLSSQEDQRRGSGLMDWWNGDGAAQVFARDENALLTERATGSRSLADMAREGCDDEACRILCASAAKLHAPRPGALPDLVPLDHWFRDLEPAATKYGGILLRCADTARMLLAESRTGLDQRAQRMAHDPGATCGGILRPTATGLDGQGGMVLGDVVEVVRHGSPPATGRGQVFCCAAHG